MLATVGRGQVINHGNLVELKVIVLQLVITGATGGIGKAYSKAVKIGLTQTINCVTIF